MSLATSSLQRLLFQFDNGWILLHLFQNICLLWPRCLHFCPQRNSFSPPDVSGEQSLDCNRMFPGLKTLEKTQQNMRNLPVQLSWGWLILHVFFFFFPLRSFVYRNLGYLKRTVHPHTAALDEDTVVQ